ncbi:protein MIS12 homolog [Sceloporus undulatus]|uniref:protein MIS12 homolog n=1 Tax=Sceloporus undulatus TaxID=8520 RepID=UPI001C4AFC2A|nr:protein MIS12 homolog [Sceloporus undulatus]XP_042298825.1 protein MIS12 homolog [Sceloporus undulatus]
MSGDLMAYETQFFGFTPQTLMLRIYIAFQDHLSHIMLVAEEAMLNKLGSAHRSITPSLVRRGTEQFFSFMKERFESLFGQIEETLLRTVLSLPKNVLLPEHQVQEKFPYSAEQFQELQDEVGRREERLKVETRAGCALQEELEEQKVVQAHLEKVLRWFDGLDSVSREEGGGNLKEGFEALTKTATKLRDVVREVERKMDQLEKL